ncbi:MAG: PHP domain-containing protein, partial [Thermoleophilia bacterium]|nr:PHP domain-containing protein [Thermoleophilia bacterium]
MAPAALVALAAECGVAVLAVTDHDSLAGVAEARAAGRALGVRVVPGVELSVKVPSGSMHLLGYFREEAPEPLSGRLEELRAARATRARRIVDRLSAIGAPVTFEEVAGRAAGAIGRPHVAEALVAAGHARDRQDAFDRFLGNGGPADVPHEGLGPRE